MMGNGPGMVRFPRNLIIGVLTAAACLKTAVARIFVVRKSCLLWLLLLVLLLKIGLWELDRERSRSGEEGRKTLRVAEER